MARVHFTSQLAAPPADRIRTNTAYPRVAQDNTVHDRLVSRDLHWGKRPLSSVAEDERQRNTAGVSIVESPTDSCDEEPISPMNTEEPSTAKDNIVQLVRSPSKNLVTLMKQRIYNLDTQPPPPSHLPLLSTPCSSNDSSSQSSDSSGRSTPSSGFLEDHMQKREDELMSSACSGLFSVVEVANPQAGSG